jgi:hypothetical protein
MFVLSKMDWGERSDSAETFVILDGLRSGQKRRTEMSQFRSPPRRDRAARSGSVLQQEMVNRRWQLRRRVENGPQAAVCFV